MRQLDDVTEGPSYVWQARDVATPSPLVSVTEGPSCMWQARDVATPSPLVSVTEGPSYVCLSYLAVFSWLAGGVLGKRDLRGCFYHPPWQLLGWRLDLKDCCCC